LTVTATINAKIAENLGSKDKSSTQLINTAVSTINVIMPTKQNLINSNVVGNL